MLRKVILLVVFALVTIPILKFIWSLGWYLHFNKHHPGKCSQVRKPGTGSEDFQILSSGQAFITTNLILPSFSPESKAFIKKRGKGTIQTIDLNLPSPEAKVIPIIHDKDFDPELFSPHGLSVLEDKVKGEHLVYVISHPENLPDRIEKFRYSPKTKELQHVKSISSDALLVTNDLSLLEEDKFYITNFLYFTGHTMTIVEHIYQPPLGGVLFYNGSGFTTVVGRLFGPNGNILSTDKRYLYVTLPMKLIVQVYKRESEYHLKLVQEVNLHTCLDNFHLSETGDSLLGGCHPIPIKAVEYSMNPAEKKAPSQVLRLPLKDGLIVEEEITEEFYDHGDLISGSSVAGVYKNKMLIGSVMHTLAVCDLPKRG